MRDPARIFRLRVKTGIGPMMAGATETHLVMLEFEHRRMYDVQLERVRRALSGEFVQGTSPVFEQLTDELDEYFAGRRTGFDVPIRLTGTAFQLKVWKALLRIPSGTTSTYARVAKSIGAPNAVRAVGKANGDNRISILVPCHRLLGSDGQLVGYGGGLGRKKKLLDVEARAVNHPLFGADTLDRSHRAR